MWGHGLARPACPLYGLGPEAGASLMMMGGGDVAKNGLSGFLNALSTTHLPPTFLTDVASAAQTSKK